jgi:hypothetical protein
VLDYSQPRKVLGICYRIHEFYLPTAQNPSSINMFFHFIFRLSSSSSSSGVVVVVIVVVMLVLVVAVMLVVVIRVVWWW